MLPRNLPKILCRARVTLNGLITHPGELFLKGKPTLGQHAHRAECDREETDTQAEQSAIAITQMFTGTVMNCPPAFRQAEWGIDRDESWASFSHEVHYLIVTERHAGFSVQIV